MNLRCPRSIFRVRSSFSRSRPRGRKAVPWIEPLEKRQLLTTAHWNSPTSGSWDVASNWSPEIVPGPGDNAVVDVPGVTVTIGSKVESVNSITSADPLVISGGGLTVAADSTISGGLSMTGGSLTARGSGVNLPVTGTTTVSGGNLYATNGASLTLNQLDSFAGNAAATTLEATGVGSTLTLANLASVTEGFNDYPAWTQFEALAGGTVTLSALKTISTGTVILEGDGTDSTLNVGALTSIAETGGQTYSTLQASNGGTVDDGNLASLSNVNLTVAGTATVSTAQIGSYNGGTITINGGSPNFSGLTSFNSGNITVSGEHR
jgi:hypothetical protein